MIKKSKFVVFILSVIPGLSHIYLGLFYRGYIFMGAAASFSAVVLGLCALTRSNRPALLLLGLPILWFVALIDSMALTDRVNSSILLNTDKKENINPGMEAPQPGSSRTAENKKIITCLLSVIPGAGHMFLGYQKQGLELMTLFFFSFFFIDWLRIGFFMFIIPVIWFYSIFDALHKASDDEIPAEKGNFFVFEPAGGNRCEWGSSKLFGYALILIGALLLFDRIISPMIPYEIRNYLQTGIVALLFIAGGIKILIGGRKEDSATGKETLEKCENGK